MNDQHRDLETTLDILDGLKEMAQKRSDVANAARARREARALARRKAEREAAKQAELERLKEEAEEEANTYRPDGPLCGALYHDSLGREVTCGLHEGHQDDDPTCDAGDGVTWPYYD